jgi:hypothetical protein
MVAKIAIWCVVSNVLVLTSIFLPAGTFAYWQGWLFLAPSLRPNTTSGGGSICQASFYVVESKHRFGTLLRE